MKENHITVAGRGVDEIEIQKSRFIGIVDRVESEEDCRALLEECRRIYPQARHYCSAWILGDQGLSKRADDDREPQGTAGLPMLHVLESQNLTWVCCVAVRYFGGVLLGTGGLARAYSQTAQIALSNAGIVQRIQGLELLCTLDYHCWGPLQYRLESRNMRISDVQYGQQVQVTFYVEPKDKEEWLQEIAAISGGTAEVQTGSTVWLAKP